MKRLVAAERFSVVGHILSLIFGWAGLLLVLPHPEFIASLPAVGQRAFELSMAGGGVVYMILGAVAVAIYAFRTLGVWHWLSFMLPAVLISLVSELLGTSTGFPFGDYRYLSGLGYKIGGLVPFTIPLSWFYVGFSAYILARAGLESRQVRGWVKEVGAIALGALLLTFWDFVLDPAMSQLAVPFWIWEQPGAFFGMPYQNFIGWFGTGVVFMSVASLLWRQAPVIMPRTQLGLPLAIYLSNLMFGTVLSLAGGFVVPVVFGVCLGFAPALVLYFMARPSRQEVAMQLEKAALEVDRSEKAQVALGVSPK
jgi:putative membrane protein